MLTCENGNDRLMDRSDLFHLQHVAGEEGGDEEGERDEDAPCGEEFLFALCNDVMVSMLYYRRGLGIV